MSGGGGSHRRSAATRRLETGVAASMNVNAGANNACTVCKCAPPFVQTARAVDIWNRRDGTGLYGKRIQGLKGGNTLTENNFWFAHPVYFLNHLDRAGLLDESFNPYANRVIARQESIGERPLRGRSVVVKDNPGFAPEFWQHSPAYEGATFKANGQAYAVPTGIFNQEYHRVTRPPYIHPHVGVDFRGSVGLKTFCLFLL
ncbi:MAG: hypothetical protein FWE20_11975 [Defluviitaleaceae bacterium]|nr:hypothetical protein [Defluviitaleaceae bacterium]